MLFKPRLLPGALLASLCTLGVATAAVLLAFFIVSTPISLNSFLMGLSVLLLLCLAVVFGYWTFGLFSLRYRVDRNAVTITSGFSREIVPLGKIERIVPGDEVPWVGPVRGVRWFGYYEGRALVENLGYAIYHCSHPRPRELLYLVTARSVYAITVKNPDRFILELHLRQELGPTRPVEQESRRWWILQLPFWRDRTVLALLAVSLLINLSMFGLITHAYPRLPELLSLHFTAQGIVDRVGFRIEVLKLPAMALVVLMSNLLLGFLLHARERAAAYLLLIGALSVQALFWVAAVRIIY